MNSNTRAWPIDLATRVTLVPAANMPNDQSRFFDVNMKLFQYHSVTLSFAFRCTD